ncbi:ABC transporter substrate-binding protein [Pleurocapsa sp. PCC 7319]|uniref:ABC transporter substrate-binding protein n=1 Tax=Pleurocapsa sp. PCC 7319 TaxID=118161 RepID=UPI00034ACC12|nr:ABC transporter substrate-binding protein [Pleurocapsa sp. PCC 7319]
MNQKRETTVLLLSLLITIGAIAGGLWWLTTKTNNSLNSSTSNLDNTAKTSTNLTPEQISTGNNILISQNITPEKQLATKALAQGNEPEAVLLLEKSLSKQPNDPEALIYLNNARIGDVRSHSIAVPVPIGTEMTTAQEILRGVAQAQNEINQQGGINGEPLKVFLADDNNNPEVAKKIAHKLVAHRDILGVVGHFSSGVTLATAPIYQENGLVAISATSTSISLSDAGNYIFRTVPSDRFTSSVLAKYFLEKLNQRQAAVIYNSQSDYSNSLKNTFTTDILSNGGLIATEVDLSQSNFNPADIIQKARSQGAEALIFLNDSTTANKAYLLMQVNNRQLPMLGGDSMYKPQTLQVVGQNAVDLVLSVPWHILGNTSSNFPTAARRLWGGDVNWRTAMAYDATKSLIAGITNDPTRQGIQQTLSDANFSFEGASGTVKFLASGDRSQSVQLVTVKPGNRSPFGYDFVPVK